MEKNGEAASDNIYDTGNPLFYLVLNIHCQCFDVARCFGKETAVEQGFPGRQEEMGRTRAILGSVFHSRKMPTRKKIKTKEALLKLVVPPLATRAFELCVVGDTG